MAVKNTLKEYRHDNRMNQTEFAAFLGISHDQYNRYERNKRQPTLEIALKISDKLGRPVNDIFYAEDEPSATPAENM
ncbi:helix-turn-helix transcriptional regulator [Cytobacillus oceanisediminis]|uniref:Transcriptional regulator n=1 Tax=Cytobacillus oceanisediminis 2691 TaxID=1196031 RepID=A0A160MA27_9BACI|nr:helix-turn-helix transcriptional regulator [Cytobacillus oceanisediminis]AND39587.1 transcriptional regulator [Cytobacillus oceanisediminis 2691]